MLSMILLLALAHASDNGGYYICEEAFLTSNKQCMFEDSDDAPAAWETLAEKHTVTRTGDDFMRAVTDSTTGVMNVSPRPWTRGNDLLATTSAVSGYVWNYALAFELVGPLRNKMMYEPDTLFLADRLEYNKWTKAFTDCEIKTIQETVVEDGRTVIGYDTDEVYDYGFSTETDVHHYILQYLEEGAIDLVCLMTDLEMSRCDTMRDKFGISSGTICDCWMDAYKDIYGSDPVLDSSQTWTECVAVDTTAQPTNSPTDGTDTGPTCCDDSTPDMSTTPPSCADGSTALAPGTSCPATTTTTTEATDATTTTDATDATTTTDGSSASMLFAMLPFATLFALL